MAAECASMTRTQTRRMQRQHKLACLKIGAMQRVQHSEEQASLLQLLGSAEAAVLLTSVAVHRTDSAATRPYHNAAVSNAASFAAQLKSKGTFLHHKWLHQWANFAKHDTSSTVDTHGADDSNHALSHTTDGLVRAAGHTKCDDLETRLLQIACGSIDDMYEDTSRLGALEVAMLPPYWAATKPLVNISKLNPDAAPFIPFTGIARSLADAGSENTVCLPPRRTILIADLIDWGDSSLQALPAPSA